jgi:general stress protein YciG
MAGNKPGPEKGDPRCVEGGRKGGEATKQKVVKDKEYFSMIGRKGGASTKEKYGPEFYSHIGRKGGESVKRDLGVEFYSNIGQKGGQATRAVKAKKKEDSINV